MEKLRGLLRTVPPTNPFWGKRLAKAGVDASGPLGNFPLLARGELLEDQRAHPPYGTNLTYPVESYCRLHQTSGTTTGQPLRCLDRAEDWNWWKSCWATIYRAAGVTRADRVIFPFSFGPFVGFWAAFESAVELGCLSLPAGGLSTAARLKFLLDNDVTVVCCTPTYALHMAEVARAERVDLASSRVKALIVAGEPGGSIAATRAAVENAFGARLFDHVGMTEMGPYAFECIEAPGGVHINETEFIAEVIDPKTGDFVFSRFDDAADGDKGSDSAVHDGELVLTNLGRLGSPLIRYRTGDHVRLQRGKCRCGSWFSRLDGGIIGRTDDMLVIRGNNVYPTAIEAILRQFPAVAEYRLIVEEHEAMIDLRIEIEPRPEAASDSLVVAVTHAVRDRFNFRPHVALVAPGSLPRFEMKAKRVLRRT